MLTPYNHNRAPLMNQQYNRPNGNYGNYNEMSEGELLGSLFGLAHQLMGEILRNMPEITGMGPNIGLTPNFPLGKTFGVSSMNVTQITRGPDGRPHVVQAHKERRLGPGGIWQTRKAIRDPERGIDKVQIGYFTGDHGEIIERHFDRATGQYHEEIQRRDFAPNEFNHPPHLPIQSQPYSRPQYPYYSSPQQQFSFYQQQQQQMMPPYRQQPMSSLSLYSQQQPPPPSPISALNPHPEKPQQALPSPPMFPYI
ncbi:unnamed protein product [Adineta ricciae]|uniref:Uncharacterized protein n=1 Tax=Adineta ricciae TaxID=249248 RepID=A0A815T4H4_ADIRI|nr:unnamed protein product [Adineta ricciae]